MKSCSNMSFQGAILLCITAILASCTQKEGFQLLSGAKTGLSFNNQIPEHPTINILSFEYLYNGGGLAIADFNRDGRDDIYFAGNFVDNQLFLNKDGFRFEDITAASGTAASKKWCNGISIIDINADEWPDIYVSVSALSFGERPKNLLFINKGLNDAGIPTFTEEAESYGIAADKHSRHAAFFDYDLDGDLDLYVLNNIIDLTDPTSYRRKVKDGTALNNDQFFENQGNNTFLEVSSEAGINFEGYGLGLAVGDINNDDYPDIYVANDYITNDLLYVNQKDGTFKNEIAERTSKQSKFSMGASLADLNNDGAPEIFVLDMLSATNDRLKRHVKESNYHNRSNNLRFGYQEQVARNTLHQNDGAGHFAEVGFFAGVYASDWSWSPLIGDWNNDGLLDIYVTNGFPKDITELDFVDYRAGANMAMNKKRIFEKLQEEKVPNCLFINQGELQFKEQAKDWRIDLPSFSNGAAYADFDQNGALDIIVNNINERAFLLKNHPKAGNNYLQVEFSDRIRYSKAFGTKVQVYQKGKVHHQEYYLHKSYLSSMAPFLHFGLGASEKVDSLIINWPSGNKSAFYNLEVNQRVHIDWEENKLPTNTEEKKTPNKLQIAETPLKHQDHGQNDFFYQRTLPFEVSHLGPCLAVADIDQDQQEEIISINENAKEIEVYNPETGIIDTLDYKLPSTGVNGMLVLDIDLDKDQDIILTYGGYSKASTELEQSFQIILQEQGSWLSPEHLTWKGKHSLGVIKGSDVDADGDIDLFLGGTSSRNQHPLASPSFLWLNEADNLNASNVTALGDLGVVMDALWTDVDQDGKTELIVAAHMHAIQIWQFKDGKLQEQSDQFISNNSTGFWNGILGMDLDNDGDTDYLLSNLGVNTPLSDGQHPITISYADYDQNGSIDPFTGFFYNNSKEEVPFDFRSEVLGQVNSNKKHFLDYQSFANTPFQSFLALQTEQKPKVLQVNNVKHQFLINENGLLKAYDLPLAAQMSPLYGFASVALDNDSFLDVLATSNLSYSREFWGTYSALNGIALLNKSAELHIGPEPKIKGDSRAIVGFWKDGNLHHYIARVDKPVLEWTTKCLDCWHYPAEALDQYAIIQFKDGSKRKEEFYYGNSFRGQSARSIVIKNISTVASIQIWSASDQRTIDLNRYE